MAALSSSQKRKDVSSLAVDASPQHNPEPVAKYLAPPSRLDRRTATAQLAGRRIRPTIHNENRIPGCRQIIPKFDIHEKTRF